jgi:hypothetical protein
VPTPRRLSNSDFDYPKGQLSGMVATPEYKATSLTTRAVSITPKRIFAVHGSRAGFPDRLLMLGNPRIQPFGSRRELQISDNNFHR